MQPFAWTFDATKVEPKQVGGAHPVGNKFPFTITDVNVVETSAKDGGMLMVEFTSPAGSIRNNYNLWNKSAQAVEVAQKQLSALCHAVGVFQIGTNQGKELIGAKGLMDINFQKGQEPSAEKPEGGYVELKKVYDINGNEPGKAPAQGQVSSGFAPQAQGQPPQAQAGAWNTAPAQAPQQPPPNQQWNAAPQQGSNPAPAPAPAGWQPGGAGAAPSAPPWGQR